MAQIRHVRVKDDEQVILELVMPTSEYLELGGQLDKVHVIAEQNCVHPTSMIIRGSGKGSVYLLAPKELRSYQKKGIIKYSFHERKFHYLLCFCVPKW